MPKPRNPTLTTLRQRMDLLARRSKPIRRLRNTVLEIKKVIDLAQTADTVNPTTTHPTDRTKRGRGRPLKHQHPLPRRERHTIDEKDRGVENFHHLHTAEFVRDCHKCYMREYLYFQRHPEKQPAYDPAGRVRKKRPWIDKGWEEDWKDQLPSLRGWRPK